MPGRDSNIVLLQGSNNAILHSCPGHLLAYLGSLGDSPSHFVQLLSCCFLLVFIFSAFSRSRKEHDTRTALQALLTIVLPTCSLWPSRYIELASVHRSDIVIPLEMIVQDTTDGVIEFRDPVNDLEDLMCSGSTAKGYTIRIIIGWRWWISYFEWWVLARSKTDYLPPGMPGCLLGRPSDCADNNTRSANLSLFLPLSPYTVDASGSFCSLCLDYLPHGITPSVNAGCKVTLEFTAFSLSLRALSTTQILSAIPFVLSNRLPRWPRTLASVLKQLSASYGSNLVINSVSNISTDYERTLGHMYESLSGEQKIRDTWVKTLGIKARRRDMFLVAFEAALLRRGWIERWAIQVTTK